MLVAELGMNSGIAMMIVAALWSWLAGLCRIREADYETIAEFPGVMVRPDFGAAWLPVFSSFPGSSSNREVCLYVGE